MGRHTGHGGFLGAHHTVERHARYGVYAFRITWGAAVSAGGGAVASASENCRVCVTRDGPAASKRPATEIVRTQRNSGVCVRACVCVFVWPGNLSLYHHMTIE